MSKGDGPGLVAAAIIAFIVIASAFGGGCQSALGIPTDRECIERYGHLAPC